MWWRCKCGAVKCDQPYRSNIEKEMLCDRCAGNARKPQRVQPRNASHNERHIDAVVSLKEAKRRMFGK